jgi:hypothetical protein
MKAWVKIIKKIIIAIFRGLSGIATEIGYALALMLAGFFICILATSL